MKDLEQDAVININMLGQFQITVGDCVINNSSKRTNQLWNLLEYLIAFRNKTISQEELISALWSEDTIENPANALKNLVYRVRTVFSSHNLSFAKDIITFKRGTYHWNNKLKCKVDTEEFEQLYRRSTEVLLSNNEKKECYRKAILLYKGNFLPDSSHLAWVIPLAGYYRSIYFKCVNKLVELLINENAYDEIINICEQAIIIDPYEELPHKYLIESLVLQNKHTAALNHYNYVTDLFYRELGVKPSEVMRSLYRDITKSINSIETDLEIIKEDLAEHSKINGTYYCDYVVFKNLYRVEARTASRTGQSIFIGLITITDKSDSIPNIQLLNDAMDKLLVIIKKSLRKGDIVSRFSATQYVLMFPSLTLGNGKNVLDRVSNNFLKQYKLDMIKIHSAIKPLDAIN